MFNMCTISKDGQIIISHLINIKSPLIPFLYLLQIFIETLTLLITDWSKIFQDAIEINMKKKELILNLRPRILNLSKSCWKIFIQFSTQIFPRKCLRTFLGDKLAFVLSSVIVLTKCLCLISCNLWGVKYIYLHLILKDKFGTFELRYSKQFTLVDKAFMKDLIRPSFICRDGNGMFLLSSDAHAKSLEHQI